MNVLASWAANVEFIFTVDILRVLGVGLDELLTVSAKTFHILKL